MLDPTSRLELRLAVGLLLTVTAMLSIVLAVLRRNRSQ